MKQKKIISENAFKQVVFRGDGNLEMEGYENVWNIKRKNTKKYHKIRQNTSRFQSKTPRNRCRIDCPIT